MPKCDLEVWSCKWMHWCSPINLLHIFITVFLRNTSRWLLLYIFFLQRLTVSLNSFLFILLSHRFIDRSLRYVWIFRRFVILEFLDTEWTSEFFICLYYTAEPILSATRSYLFGYLSRFQLKLFRLLYEGSFWFFWISCFGWTEIYSLMVSQGIQV